MSNPNNGKIKLFPFAKLKRKTTKTIKTTTTDVMGMMGITF